MDERARLLAMIADPRLVSDLPGDDARRLLIEVAVLQGGLVALQGALLPRVLGQDTGGSAQTPQDQCVTVKDAAQRLSVSASYIYKHWRALSFCFRIGRRVVCSVKGLERELERRRGRAA